MAVLLGPLLFFPGPVFFVYLFVEADLVSSDCGGAIASIDSFLKVFLGVSGPYSEEGSFDFTFCSSNPRRTLT